MGAGRSALIVATSTYADARLATLEGPAKDAAALKGVLGARDIGGFEVRTLLNARASQIRETLEAFFTDRARDDLLLVSVSCHGLKDDDGQLFLAASDTKLDRLMSTGIDAGWVNRLMDRCRSERIALFLDCCFAGAFSSGMTRRAGGETAGVKDQFTGRGMVVITASDAMQYSFEGGRQVGEPPGPSPFTKALVDGLRTGEADQDEDGNVSINELFDYLERRVRETSPSQTPTKSAVNQTGDWVIARSRRVPSVKLLPERVQLLLKSGESIDRLEAIIDLERIRSSTNARTAQAATAALQTLTGDDSRRVAQRAMQALGNERVTPAPTGSAVEATATIAQVTPRPNGVEVDPDVGPREAASVPVRAGPTPLALDIARGAARGFIGSLIGVVLGIALVLTTSTSLSNLQSAQIQNAILWIGVGVTIFATLVELTRLRLPVRGIPLWTAIAANRWAEAAITGVAASLVVFVLNLGDVIGGVGFDFETVVFLTAPMVIGFLIGEAVVGSARPHAAPGSASRPDAS